MGVISESNRMNYPIILSDIKAHIPSLNMIQKKQIQISLTKKEQQELDLICKELGIDKDFLVSNALKKLLIELKQNGSGECVC